MGVSLQKHDQFRFEYRAMWHPAVTFLGGNIMTYRAHEVQAVTSVYAATSVVWSTVLRVSSSRQIIQMHDDIACLFIVRIERGNVNKTLWNSRLTVHFGQPA